MEITASEITATVTGSADYDVTLTMDDEDVTGECSCPYGLEGNFCKHCVAVGLTLLSEGTSLQSLHSAAQAKAQSLNDWLTSLTRQELLDLVLRQVAEDRDLRRRLELRAATADHDISAIRARIMDLLDTQRYGRHGYVEYAEAFGYAEQVSEAVAAIDALVEAGNAMDAIGIAREAIELLTDTYENLDDSSGYVGEALNDILAAHARACSEAHPDPVELGDYLADKLLTPDLIEFDLSDYTEVLGTEGLARIRERVNDAWTRNPSGWVEKQLMESFVRAEGTVDSLVEVMAADLDDHGYTHLRIAMELDRAARPEDALTWAERGWREVARPDSRLADYLVDRYQKDGRLTDALDIRHAMFKSTRTLAAYRQLRETATKAGAWTDIRGTALESLRDDATGRRSRWADAVWIDALIDDDDIGGAWQAAAGIASDAQWLRLADAVAITKPADALTVYLRLIEPLRRDTGDSIYQQIARLLVSARGCWLRLDQMNDYSAYVVALRADQKRKRNLMRILDQHKL